MEKNPLWITFGNNLYRILFASLFQLCSCMRRVEHIACWQMNCQFRGYFWFSFVLLHKFRHVGVRYIQTQCQAKLIQFCNWFNLMYFFFVAGKFWRYSYSVRNGRQIGHAYKNIVTFEVRVNVKILISCETKLTKTFHYNIWQEIFWINPKINF